MPDRKLRINPDRMLAAFNELAQIGATADGGVNRPSFSESHLAARAWFRGQVEKSGLEFRTDGAGNHSAVIANTITTAEKEPLFIASPLGKAKETVHGDVLRLRSERRYSALSEVEASGQFLSSEAGTSASLSVNSAKQSPTLLLGSHLDSVPNGGRFDGALGVMAALEVLRTVKDAGLSLKLQLEAIDFSDEEGTLVGLLGSAAIAGRLHPELLQNPRGGRQALVEGMRRAGLSDDGILNAARPKDSLAGYLELHIEQGKRLERAEINIGVVSAIVGIWSYRLSFIGRADHAGSTTMNDRLDASLGASAFTLAAREIVLKDFPNCVVNVGKMEFMPGAFNIVPARVDVALEFRSSDEGEFKRLDSALIACAKTQAKHFGLELKTDFLSMHMPSIMNENIKRAIFDSCAALGLTHTSLVSGAGHDGQMLTDICPVGMIFVPSVDGASHAPRELTHWEDCVNGANVLLQAALRLAE